MYDAKVGIHKPIVGNSPRRQVVSRGEHDGCMDVYLLPVIQNYANANFRDWIF